MFCVNCLRVFSYNVSHAARYGDVGLILVIVIAVTVLKKIQILPSWLTSDAYNWFCALSCLAIGVIIEVSILKSTGWQFGQVVDVYHNLAIVPLFLYLLAILLPITYLYGNFQERAFTIFFLLLWLVLVIYDIHADRLDQRTWLTKHGYDNILKNK